MAYHGNERMIRRMITQNIGVAGVILTSGDRKVNGIFNGVFGPGSQLAFTLPNLRKQEHEADHFGLMFAAMAGYNPR